MERILTDQSKAARSGLLWCLIATATSLFTYVPGVSAQSVWERLGQDEFKGIAYISSERIVAVASEGRILVSGDGGGHWSRQHINTYTNLIGVSFHGTDHGIVLGEQEGEIFYTRDAGATWTLASKTISDLANHVAFASNDTAVIAGSPGKLYRTEDGGQTWNALIVPATSRINAVKFLNARIGFAVGEHGLILKTVDAGATWQKKSSGTDWFMLGVDMLDSLNGVAAGWDDPSKYTGIDPGIVLKTTDGGESWVSISPPDSFNFDVWGVWMMDKDNVLINGVQDFFRTADGGKNWTREGVFDAFAGHGSYESLSYIDSNRAFVAGQNGLIMSTENGGKAWNVRSSSQLGVSNIQHVTGPTFYAIGGSNVYRSVDSGTTWKWLIGMQYANSYAFITDFHFVDTSKGIALDAGYGILYRTTNGGTTWTEGGILGGGGNLFYPDTSDANNCYTVGDSSIYHTTDGWATWSTSVPLHLDGTLYFHQITFDKTGKLGFLTAELIAPVVQGGKDTEYFRGYRTTDGGATWARVLENVPQAINTFYIKNSQTVFAAGSTDILYRSDDGGRTWTNLHQGTDPIASYASIAFMNDSIGFVAGYDTSILVTSDGGRTWIKEDPWPSDAFRSSDEGFSKIIFPYPNTVFLCGTHCFFRKTYSFAHSAVHREEYDFTGKYLYFTCQPNPVSRFTTIKFFGLNSMGGVPATLRIYDLLGREVANLTNELHSIQGDEGQVDWNVNQIPAGAYYAQFSGGSFSRSVMVVVIR